MLENMSDVARQFTNDIIQFFADDHPRWWQKDIGRAREFDLLRIYIQHWLYSMYCKVWRIKSSIILLGISI